VLLSLIGTLSSWSAMWIPEDGIVYIIVNIALLVSGGVALWLGYVPPRNRSAGRN
jgi:hypothetical protein